MSDYKNQVEAILFASGRFMDVATLMNLTGASDKQVIKSNVEKLIQEYSQRESPLMIVEEKDGWKITVREKYLPLVRKIVSDMELPKTVLETLAVIAWKSPVLQSEVIRVRHNKAYDHISELEELGFIVKEKQGRSYILKLSEKFFEYFDVDGTHDIKEFLKKAKIPEAPETPEPVQAEEPKPVEVYDDFKKEEEKVAYDTDTEHLGALEVYNEEETEKEIDKELGDREHEEENEKQDDDFSDLEKEPEDDTEQEPPEEPSDNSKGKEGLEDEPHDEDAEKELFGDDKETAD